MNAKKVLPLVAAAILGLAAAKMVVTIAQGNKGTASLNKLTTAKVVVVKQNLQAGQEITNDDVTVGELAVESATGPVFHDPSEVIGRVATIPLITGQAVLETLLAPKGSGSGLQAIIPAGMRAVTLETDEFSSVAGYLSPGCHVDILHTMHDEATGQQVTRTILQNLLITAIGMKSAGADGQPQQARSATLLVTPHEAEIIALATNGGRPRMILRNSRDG
jgi:pilus assembly protein CpaB